MFKKINDYFREKYIAKTFKKISYDINCTDLDFENILKKYDTKSKIEDKLLVYSIFNVACELKTETKDYIIVEVLSSFLENLKDSYNVENRLQHLEICKLKIEIKYLDIKTKSFISTSNVENVSEFSPKHFSKNNFALAVQCVQNLHENNEQFGNLYCKSYKTLTFSKTSIELAFNYLIDSVRFDKDSQVFKDDNYANNLSGLHMYMLTTYLDIDLEEIPKDKIEQVKFNSSRRIDLGKNQLEITKLINWRNKEQWLYYVNSFGIDSDLGKVSLEKSNNI